MAKIKNAAESWNGHTREEVEEFIKEQDKAAAEERATLKKNKADTAAIMFEKGAGSGSAVLKDGGNKAPANHSVAEGWTSTASGSNSHSEGYQSEASGNNSHAEGHHAQAAGNNSHAEGYDTQANGHQGHAEGRGTAANASCAHAEGYQTIAGEANSHAEGGGTQTSNNSEHAEGKYNLSHKGAGAAGTLHSVGIGTSDTARKNAFEIMQNGDVYVFGIGGYDGTNAGASGVKTLQTIISEISMGGGA